jgi:hypothetical protein
MGRQAVDLENDTRGHYNSIQAKANLKMTLFSARAAFFVTAVIGLIVTLLNADSAGNLKAFFVGLTLINMATVMVQSIQISGSTITIFRHQDASKEEESRQGHELREDVEEIKKILSRIAETADDELGKQRGQRAGH